MFQRTYNRCYVTGEKLNKANYKDPLYRKIYKSITEDIGAKKDMKLSINTLMEKYSISRNTAYRIIALLEENGWVRKVQGRGTFPVPENTEKIHSINILYNENYFEQHLINRYPYAHFQILKGVLASELSDKCNIKIVLLRNSESLESKLEKIRGSGPGEGYLLLDQEGMKSIVDCLKKERFPHICFAPHGSDCNYVSYKNYDAVYKGVSQLLQSGRKNLLFVGSKTNEWMAPRYSAFCDAIKDAGLKVESNNQIDLTQSGMSKFLSLIKESENPPDGIFVGTFITGQQILSSFELAGIKIPDDIGFMGFFDIQDYKDKSISTIRAPLQEIGRLMVEKLLEQIEVGYRDDIAIELGCELIIRSSF